MRILGGECGLPDRLRGNLFIHSFVQGFLENVSGFRYQQLWFWISGGGDQQMLGGQLLTEMGGMRTSLAMVWTLALPAPTLRRQTRWLAIRAPPVGFWPSVGSVHWVRSHSDHVGVCPSLCLAK